MTTHHSPAGNSHDHGQDGHASSPKSGSMKGLLLMIPIIIFGIIIMKFLFSSSGEKTENQNNNTSNNTTEKAYMLKPKHVNYGPNYDNIIYLPSGFDYYFDGATEPYCYSNKNNEEACGEKGEDVSNELGNSSANKSLRFKSQNGKNGYLDIILIKK